MINLCLILLVGYFFFANSKLKKIIIILKALQLFMNTFLQKYLQFLILMILADYIQEILFQYHHVEENLLLG